MAVVSQIATQGRQDANEWSSEYKVAYSLDGILFNDYPNTSNQLYIFEGNLDKNTVKVFAAECVLCS